MYGNNYNTNPYGMPTNMYNQPGYPVVTPTPSVNTNKIYVTDEKDARNRWLPPNSDYIFLDNDKAILYQKIVDSKGQFEVKAFKITPYTTQEKDDLSILKDKITSLENQLNTLIKEKDNGARPIEQREQEVTIGERQIETTN